MPALCGVGGVLAREDCPEDEVKELAEKTSGFWEIDPENNPRPGHTLRISLTIWLPPSLGNQRKRRGPL